MEINIQPLSIEDKSWIKTFLRERWGSHLVVTRGKIQDASELPGFFAKINTKIVGLATYKITGKNCELVTLDSLKYNIGVGTSLIEKVKTEAHISGCTRLWLITTNDNLHALGYYQKRGFHLVAVYPNALALSRELKHSIPIIGMNGIPLRDEIELQFILE